MAKVGKVNMAAITKEIAKIEGKFSEVSVGNIREVLAIISDMVYEDLECFSSFEGGHRGVVSALYQNGRRRSRRSR